MHENMKECHFCRAIRAYHSCMHTISVARDTHSLTHTLLPFKTLVYTHSHALFSMHTPSTSLGLSIHTHKTCMHCVLHVFCSIFHRPCFFSSILLSSSSQHFLSLSFLFLFGSPRLCKCSTLSLSFPLSLHPPLLSKSLLTHTVFVPTLTTGTFAYYRVPHHYLPPPPVHNLSVRAILACFYTPLHTTLSCTLYHALTLLCYCKKQNYDTRDSHVVPHRGTNRAVLSLTSQIGRDAVFSQSYGRR